MDSTEFTLFWKVTKNCTTVNNLSMCAPLCQYRVGIVMQELVTGLADKYEGDAAFAVLHRVFDEHFIVEETVLRPKKGDELTANSLQSPDDLEATFRKKRGDSYIDYVTNITETAFFVQ